MQQGLRKTEEADSKIEKTSQLHDLLTVRIKGEKPQLQLPSK